MSATVPWWPETVAFGPARYGLLMPWWEIALVAAGGWALGSFAAALAWYLRR